MRKLVALLSLTLVMAATVMAQPVTETESSSGILPGNPLYSVEKLVENIEVEVAGIIGGPDLKAKALANNAQERLVEARTLSERNQSERAAEAVRKYSDTMNRSRSIAAGNGNKELGQQIQNISDRNTEALQEVRERVPEQAKRGIDNAIQRSGGRPPGRQSAENLSETGPGNNLGRAQNRTSEIENRTPEGLGNLSENVDGRDNLEAGSNESERLTDSSGNPFEAPGSSEEIEQDKLNPGDSTGQGDEAGKPVGELNETVP